MDFTPELVRAQLERLLASEVLSKSATTRRLLAYLVQRTLDATDGPKEVEIAIDVFGRDVRFNGSEDSVVRVAMRSVRQKLLEYYTGAGRADPLILDIPKGAYRVTFVARADAEPVGAQQPATEQRDAPNPEPVGSQASQPWPRRTVWWLRIGVAVAAVIVLLAVVRLYPRHQDESAEELTRRELREDPFWKPLVGDRPLVFVLGDLFMYTQTDQQTGRVQTVRDPQINSSDDLRVFLAGNPSLAAGRGLRYSTMLQKSTTVGMVQILRLLDGPGRRIEVRLRDELQAEDIRTADIIYLGPITRVGPLASDNRLHSRYRFDVASSSIIDTETQKSYLPEGDLSAHYRDYALVSAYPGPTGNHILVVTAGGRNAGLLQIVRTLVSPEGLGKFRGDTASRELPPAFEALLAVTGYKQTDLSADLVALHPMTLTDPPR